MSLSIVEADDLTDDVVTGWRTAPHTDDGADGGHGIVVTAGALHAIVAPSATVGRWLGDRYGAQACLATELASFVYRRKAWFAPTGDPLALRDVRPGQYEVRVVTEATGSLVPLFAMDLAPVRHQGTWATIDQRAPHPAASLLEIAVVPGDQPVVVGGVERRLGGLACGTRRLWEASRLGSVTELVRLTPGADEAALPWFPLAQERARELDALSPGHQRIVHETGRALFGVALGWAFARLPIDVVVGLSQGRVVRAFTAALTGAGAPCHHPLRLAGWHADAAARTYAPGYFATGDVQGYTIDGAAAQDRFVTTGRRRLRRAAHAATDGLTPVAGPADASPRHGPDR